MGRLKVAIVGSGLIAAHRHLPAFTKFRKDAEVISLCDLNYEQAQKVAHKFGIPKIYKELNELLENEHPDIVDICTPPQTHAQLAITAMKGAADVLIEKPMALTVEECDNIINTSQMTKKSVCIAHSDLFYPAFIKARELVENDVIGEFKGMRIFLSTPVDYITSKPSHWAHRLPGGVIGESGPHAVYMTLAFINPILDVKVCAKKLLYEYPWSPFEDYRVDLIGENAISSITLIYTTNQWSAQVDILGSRSIIKVDLESQDLIHYDRPLLSSYTVGRSVFSGVLQTIKSISFNGIKLLSKRHYRPHDLLIRQLLKSLKNGDSTPVSPQEGREAVRVMNLIVERLNSK